jgi:hypothetical protein
MSGTWAVLDTREGPRLSGRMTAGYTQAEAEQWAAELPGLLGDPAASFTTADLLPGLERRFQPGTAVWLGTRVYWRRGQRGTVTAGEPESYAKWAPQDGILPWFVGSGGAEVFVALDDGYASWWPAGWLDTR